MSSIRKTLQPVVKALREIERMAQYTCANHTCVGGYLERGMHAPDCPRDYLVEAQEALDHLKREGLIEE